MSNVEIMTRVERLVSSRDQEATEQWTNLVDELARDGEPAPEDVIAIVEARGRRTYDELQDAVELKRKRIAWAAKLDGEDELAAKRDAVEEEYRKATARCNQALAQFEEAKQQYAQKTNRVIALTSEIREARQQLVTTAPRTPREQEIPNEMRAIEAKRNPIVYQARTRRELNDRDTIEKTISEYDRQIAELRDELERLNAAKLVP